MRIAFAVACTGLIAIHCTNAVPWQLPFWKRNPESEALTQNTKPIVVVENEKSTPLQQVERHAGPLKGLKYFGIACGIGFTALALVNPIHYITTNIKKYTYYLFI